MIPSGSAAAAQLPDGPAWAELAVLPGVAEAMAEARAMVDRVLVHRVLRSRAPALAAESSVRGARASAALDGVDVPLDEVRAAVAPDPVLAGALRAQVELHRLRAVWHSSPRQAIARLHVLAAAGLAEPELLGRPVDAGAAAALGRVAVLAGAKAPALMVAAVVHGELVAASAFGAANGVVARAASRLVLSDKGLDPALLTVPEVGHVELGDYAAAAMSYGSGDPAPWLLHCAGAALIGARESLAIAESMVRG